MIGKIKDDDVARQLHSICYGKPGKQTTRKKGLRAFNGWADASVAKTKADKLATNNKVKVSMIKEVCGVLGLEKSGTKDEVSGVRALLVGRCCAGLPPPPPPPPPCTPRPRPRPPSNPTPRSNPTPNSSAAA